jgi:hypothetical protein
MVTDDNQLLAYGAGRFLSVTMDFQRDWNLRWIARAAGRAPEMLHRNNGSVTGP